MGVTHTFVSTIEDGGDATLVRPSNWNATHTVSIADGDIDTSADVLLINVGIVIDGGGDVITTGSKGYRAVDFSGTVTAWTILAAQSGSIVVDVHKCTYAGFPTTASIAGTELPTLSSVQKNQDTSLTTWTTTITAGDILEFIVDSVATVTRVAVTLKVKKT